jgi:hypothetical protein
MHSRYSVTAAAVVALGGAAWSYAGWAGDAPPKAAAPVKSAAVDSKAADSAQKVGAKRPLDLSAPPVERVLTPEQVRSFVTEPEDDGAPPQDVTVASPHYLEPVPNGPFVALPWALLHPLQAWRIFAPITD